MSQDSLHRYKIPPLRDRHRRSVGEWIALRFPRTARLMRSAAFRLPLSSRLRRILLTRGVRDGYEAFNRRDWAAVFSLYDPQAEIVPVATPGSERVPLDLEDRYHGRDGLRRFMEGWDEAWEEFRFQPEELIDFGSRWLVLARYIGHSKRGGIDLEHSSGQILVWERGSIVRDEVYLNREQALEAVGLRKEEGASSSPKPSIL